MVSAKATTVVPFATTRSVVLAQSSKKGSVPKKVSGGQVQPAVYGGVEKATQGFGQVIRAGLGQAIRAVQRAEMLMSDPFARQIEEMPKLLSSKRLTTAQKLKFVRAALKSGNLELQLTTLRSVEKQAELAKRVAKDSDCIIHFEAISRRTISNRESYTKQAELRRIASKYLSIVSREREICNRVISRIFRGIDYRAIEITKANCISFCIRHPLYCKCISKVRNTKGFDKCLRKS